MDLNKPQPLLGGLSAAEFMRRHWQRKPLVVRQAVPGMQPPLARTELFRLAASDAVESRLVTQLDGQWELRHGPFTRRSLPPLKQAGWTLLVQGVDLHDDRAHQLMQPFRFVPDARLDDLMISYASDGGGVGPHLDSYDVFLLQAAGRRRWRYGRQTDTTLIPGMPVRLLANFEPEFDEVLEPGDMLYLPPGWAHDGVAVGGDCMTCSVGFRQPTRGELVRELLWRMAEGADEDDTTYRDRGQPAVAEPAAIPETMLDFARSAVERSLSDRDGVALALGEWLTEPKAMVTFDLAHEPSNSPAAVVLDRRTRMLHGKRHVFINGESYRASGTDLRLMRRLANARRLDSDDLARLSPEAQALVAEWIEAGWLHAG